MTKKQSGASDNKNGGDSSSQTSNQKSSSNTPTRESGKADVKPIEISFDEAGNLILKGDDLEALDRLERMMQTNAPPQKRVRSFLHS
jgi:hypothetical protein